MADRDEERDRIRRIQTATCLGCLAAAMGEPIHVIAETRYAPRSYEGDAWEAGWEFIHGSATWQSHAKLQAENARLKHFVTDSGQTCWPCETCGHATAGQCLWCENARLREELAKFTRTPNHRA